MVVYDVAYTTRPMFARTPVQAWREIIKSHLKHWRKLANMSQRQAAQLCHVSRNTVAAWENPEKAALPDAAQLAALADAARIEPSAALDWLTGGPERRTL